MQSVQQHLHAMPQHQVLNTVHSARTDHMPIYCTFPAHLVFNALPQPNPTTHQRTFTPTIILPLQRDTLDKFCSAVTAQCQHELHHAETCIHNALAHETDTEATHTAHEAFQQAIDAVYAFALQTFPTTQRRPSHSQPPRSHQRTFLPRTQAVEYNKHRTCITHARRILRWIEQVHTHTLPPSTLRSRVLAMPPHLDGACMDPPIDQAAVITTYKEHVQLALNQHSKAARAIITDHLRHQTHKDARKIQCKWWNSP